MSLSEYDMPQHNIVLRAEGVENIAGLVEELGRFAASSRFIVGVTVESRATNDNTAFTGGHTTAYREDYGTMTVALDTNEGIRDATRLLISDERLAEIADSYVLPDHLKEPTNHVDAFIGHVIKGLVGYQEDIGESFADQAEASTDSLVAMPDITSAQATVFRSFGRVNLSRAQKNTLYRSQQVETMEHVLRFLIARKQAKPYTNGNFSAGIDYEFAIGLLGEALSIVNGVNGFNEDPDPTTNDLLYRGTLQQKSSLAVKDKVVYYSGVRGPEPIWPPEQVEAYQSEQIEKARVRDAELRAQQAQREAADAKRREILAQQQALIGETMDVLASEGYEWKGIMQIIPAGPMDSADKVRDYYAEKYGANPQDIRIIENFAIYGGKTAQHAPGSVTVYIRNNQASNR